MFRTLSSIALLFLSALFASAQGHDIGTVEVKADLKTKALRITGSPELASLAQMAFRTHGAFRLVPGGAAYTANFTPAGANQVRVEITTGNPARSVVNQTVSGSSTRNALFRAADLVVEQLTGLKGFFAGKITFVSERTGRREVYTSDLFFGEVVQVTHDNAHALSPRWSPDGGRIVYTSFYRSGSPDIYILDPRSGQHTPWASFKGTNSGGRFSPDGGQIAAALSAGGNQEIFAASAAGRGFRRLTNSAGVEASPVWSPDGSRLLFTSDREGRPQLYVMSAGGGTMSRIPTNLSTYCAEPDWSAAKPNLISFTAAVGSSFQVAIYDLNTHQGQIVTRGGGDNIESCWLADGRHLLCTGRSADVRVIKIVDTESAKSPTVISPAALGQVQQANYWKR